jgi:hypothetical protein
MWEVIYNISYDNLTNIINLGILNYKNKHKVKNMLGFFSDINCGKHISNVVALYLKCLRAFFDYL